MAVDPDNSADDLNAQELRGLRESFEFEIPAKETDMSTDHLSPDPVVMPPETLPPVAPTAPPLGANDPAELPPAANPAPVHADIITNAPVANPAPTEQKYVAPYVGLLNEIKEWIDKLSADVRAGVIAHFVEQEKTKRVTQIVGALTAARDHQKVLNTLNKPDTVIKDIAGNITHAGFSDALLSKRTAHIEAANNIKGAIEKALDGNFDKLPAAVDKVNKLKGNNN